MNLLIVHPTRIDADVHFHCSVLVIQHRSSVLSNDGRSMIATDLLGKQSREMIKETQRQPVID